MSADQASKKTGEPPVAEAAQQPPHRHLDTSGTLCPIPVVEARRALAGMAAGEILEVVATDPLAELDLTVLCDRTGHELLAANTSPDGRIRVLIRVSPGQSEDAG